MVYTAVTLKVRDNGTFAWAKKLPEHTKRIGNREAWNLTQQGAKIMRVTHLQNTEAWKGRIRRGMKPKKIVKGTYGIEFSKQAIGIDRMRPHWVSLKRGRLITEWARARGIKKRAIWVTKKPYIEAGYLKMLGRLDQIILKRIADKIVRG